MKDANETYFWASYSDLMTSLFFVMLVLFVITVAILQNKMVAIDNERKATQSQIDKIREVEKATESIDPKYFEYRASYKKHILRIPVKFNVGSSDFNDISYSTQQELKKAGESIVDFIRKNSTDGIQYLLIIEGQASKETNRERFKRNYELSYERALALKKFWETHGVDLGASCEVLVSGSGDGVLSGTGFMREVNEPDNQRFLIHIVPKYGTISK